MLKDLPIRLAALRERAYPFSLLSGHRASEALESLKTYQLSPGERLTLDPGNREDLLYVLDGEVEVQVPGRDPVRLDAETTRGSPYHLKRAVGPIAIAPLSDSIVCRADSEVLDYLLSWETLSGGLGADDDAAGDRIAAVRRSLAFRRLPLESVEEAFRRMRSVAVSAGDEVVRQGDPGDAFYLIERGRAEVWQTGIYDDEPKLVGELKAGDAFGEEALVLRGARNATVRMVEDGVLLALDQVDFDELFRNTMIQRVQAPVAKALIDAGHIVLDVRYEEEFEDAHMPGSVLIPLHELRRRVGELDPSKSYVVHCKSGGRSAVGTLLLRQRGFDAVSIEGGLRDWPYEIITG
jgi:rhodanese-related sulfurtransferase